MKDDGKIHIPARKKLPVTGSQVGRMSEEAYNALIEVYNETYMSMKDLTSMFILYAAERVVFDKED